MAIATCHRVWRSWVLGLALLALAAAPAAAGRLEQLRGHISLGYALAVLNHAPPGSASFGAGLDYPLREDLSVGANVDYHLLGRSTVTRGVLQADVDYTLFVADAALTWWPGRYGPLRAVSLLAGAYGAHAELSSAPGGTTFFDLSVSEVAPGGGLALTFMRRQPAPIRVGLEVAGHLAVLHDRRDWGLVTARLAIHY